MDPDASAAGEPIPSPPHPGKRARSLRDSPHPDWVMLDCFPRHARGDDPSGATVALAYELTSTGDCIGVGFNAASPPETSRILYDWFPKPTKKKGRRSQQPTRHGPTRSLPGKSPPWSSDAARAVSAHRDAILLRFRFPMRPSSNEFFVYRSGGPAASLTRLAACVHGFVNYGEGNDMGIVCRDDGEGDGGEFAVAHLSVAPTTEADAVLFPRGACTTVTAELCCMRSGSHEADAWRTTRLSVLDGEGQDLRWWETDAVVPFGDRICWVDYLRGILICDVFSPSPELHYVPLPVNPYHGRWHPDYPEFGRTRGNLYRTVCVAGHGDGAIKFVDASHRDLWFYGDAHYSSTPSNFITSWTLSGDLRTWTVDGAIEVEKFFHLTTCLNLGCIRPELPVVDVNDPKTIYFVVKERVCVGAATFLVAADMLSRTLHTPVAYLLRSTMLSCGGGDSYTSSCNLVYNEPFLPCQFSRYLGQDVPDPDTRDKKTRE